MFNIMEKEIQKLYIIFIQTMFVDVIVFCLWGFVIFAALNKT